MVHKIEVTEAVFVMDTCSPINICSLIRHIRSYGSILRIQVVPWTHAVSFGAYGPIDSGSQFDGHRQSHGHMQSGKVHMILWIKTVNFKGTCSPMDTCSLIGYIRSYG